jgi:predicted DNA-binding transcriptional regulator AlpA
MRPSQSAPTPSADLGRDYLGEAYLTQKEVAAHLRLSERTLERHRVCGTGPRFVKLGRRIVYRRRDVEDWAAAHTVSSTSEAEVRLCL